MSPPPVGGNLPRAPGRPPPAGMATRTHSAPATTGRAVYRRAPAPKDKPKPKPKKEKR
jgi:hypothetical protein